MGSLDEKQKFVSIVATALHNAAVEYEFVQDYSNSLIHYQKAVRISQIHLGAQNQLTLTFEGNFEQAKEKIQSH